MITKRSLGAAAAFAVVVAGGLYLSHSSRSEPPPPMLPEKAQAATPERAREIPPEVAKKLSVGVARVERKPIARDLEVVGTVVFDQDRVGLAGPRLSGRVIRLRARPGDVVRAGEVLAELESVELGRAAAEYLGVRARMKAAAAHADRERELAQHNVSSARDREVAEAEARALGAQVRAAEQVLLALGLTREELPDEEDARPLAHFAVRAPIGGVVVERRAVVGEAVEAGKSIYRVADLRRVWVELDVYERDLAWVRPGLEAELRTESFRDRVRARVEHVGAEIDEKTRTAHVHLDVDNAAGHLRPGQFVTAHLRSDGPGTPALAIPRDALQTLDGKTVVFVRTPAGGFVVRDIGVGSRGTKAVEVTGGLEEGQEVATENAFLLKSEVLR